MKPCNVKHLGEWYHVTTLGTVYLGKAVNEPSGPVNFGLSQAVRQTVQRLRANKRARLNDQARRDLGLVRTPYGWE